MNGVRTISAKQALTAQGWARDVVLRIADDGRIAEIAENQPCVGQPVDLLLPAPANLHSHAFQRAMAGLTEVRGPDPHDSFWTWRRLMYRFLDQLRPEQIQAIAALVYMEMLEAGFASVAEFHYLHHQPGGVPYDAPAELSQRIVAAAQTAGIGLTLLPVLYQFGGCDRRPLQGGQLRFANTPDQFHRLFDGAQQAVGAAGHHIGVSPHSLRAVDRPGLAAAMALCPDGPIHMHLAEQIGEVDEVQAHLGARPVEWVLDTLGPDRRWCLIHCTQMTARETRDLAQTGAVAGLCPLTESNLGDGIFNGETFVDAGGALGVGSDSNVQISLFEELKTLEYSQRLATRRRAVLAHEARSTGRHLFDLACAGGAQATQRDAGRIAPGVRADLIGISTDNHWLNNDQGDRLLDALIFGGGARSCITDVFSSGAHVVQAGRHVRRDQIIAAYRQVMTELRATL